MSSDKDSYDFSGVNPEQAERIVKEREKTKRVHDIAHNVASAVFWCGLFAYLIVRVKN